MTTIVGHLKAILELDSASYEESLKKSGKATGAAAKEIQSLASSTSQNARKLLTLADAANVNIYALSGLGRATEGLFVGLSVLRTGMSVLGGPGGIALAAAAAVATFAASTTKAYEATENWSLKLAQLNEDANAVQLIKLRQDADDTVKKLRQLGEDIQDASYSQVSAYEKEIKAARDYLAVIYERIRAQEQLIAAGIGPEAPKPEAQGRGGQDAATLAQKERDQIAQRLEDMQQSFYTEEQMLAVNLANKWALIQQSEALKDVSDAERAAWRLQAEAEYQAGITRIAQEETQKRVRTEQQASQAITSLKQSVANNAVGFLRAIAPESKAAALAGIVVAKMQAIASAKASTLAAAQLAYASQLVPGDPTSLLRAEAARQSTLATGALNVGLIAGIGLAEAAGVMSGGGGGSVGGAGGGGGGGTVASNYAPAVPASSSASGGAVTQFNFYGDDGTVYTQEQLDAMLDALEDAINRGDRVFINRNSRQAMELMA